jgi:hypothetical protein
VAGGQLKQQFIAYLKLATDYSFNRFPHTLDLYAAYAFRRVELGAEVAGAGLAR